MVYPGAWGKLINKKNLKSKISWHCPFKQYTSACSPSREYYTCKMGCKDGLGFNSTLLIQNAYERPIGQYYSLSRTNDPRAGGRPGGDEMR
jgi:hypothetical protein